jgi:hypothetical protein
MLRHEPSYQSILLSLNNDSENRVAVTEDVKFDNGGIKVEVPDSQDYQSNETGENQLILLKTHVMIILKLV